MKDYKDIKKQANISVILSLSAWTIFPLLLTFFGVLKASGVPIMESASLVIAIISLIVPGMGIFIGRRVLKNKKTRNYDNRAKIATYSAYAFYGLAIFGIISILG